MTICYSIFTCILLLVIYYFIDDSTSPFNVSDREWRKIRERVIAGNKEYREVCELFGYDFTYIFVGSIETAICRNDNEDMKVIEYIRFRKEEEYQLKCYNAEIKEYCRNSDWLSKIFPYKIE